jgi:hypothetical protein
MRLIAATALALLGYAAAASAADTLDVKEGLWESTSTMTIQGLQIPPALLQNLPEEQRAQIERFDGRPHLDHACVTQKDIAAGFTRFDKQSACTRNTLAATPRNYAANITCTGLLAGTGTLQVQAPSPSRVQGSAALQGMLGNMTMTLDARWISASCGALKK